MKVIIFKYIKKIFSPFLNLTGDVFVTFNHMCQHYNDFKACDYADAKGDRSIE